MNRPRTFLVLWTLAAAAVTAAFCVRLAIRSRTIELGYELGRSYGHLERLREVKRVLELELMSQKTPERVGLVAHSLLGMTPPSPERILSAGANPLPVETEPEIVEGPLPSASEDP